MNELPAPTLQSKHAGHAHCYRYYLLRPPDLGSAALHFDDAGESFGDVLRYEVYINDFAVAVVRGGASKRLLHILPTAYVRPERVPQGSHHRLANTTLGRHSDHP